MKNLTKSPRYYAEFYTGKIFDCYVNNDTHQTVFICRESGEMVTNFVCAAFNSITYKFWDKSEINLQVGQFLKVDSKNKPIAKKFTGIQKRFVKL